MFVPDMIATTIIEGELVNIFPMERYGDFTKLVFWVKENVAKYPRMWPLELWHDDIGDINAFRVGESLQCDVEVNGKLWSKNGKESVLVTLRAKNLRRLTPEDVK